MIRAAAALFVVGPIVEYRQQWRRFCFAIDRAGADRFFSVAHKDTDDLMPLFDQQVSGHTGIYASGHRQYDSRHGLNL